MVASSEEECSESEGGGAFFVLLLVDCREEERDSLFRRGFGEEVERLPPLVAIDFGRV